MRRSLLLVMLGLVVAVSASYDGGYDYDRPPRPHAPPPRRCRLCGRGWDRDYRVVNGVYQDTARGQFVEEAFEIVLREVRRMAASEDCRLVGVQRERACYESIIAVSNRQYIGAYGFEFSARFMCRGSRRPVYKQVLAETLNRRHAPHLIAGEIQYL